MVRAIIYRLTSPSGKSYIGQTIRTIEVRLYEHETRRECLLIYNAIQKYGIDKFEVDIIDELDINSEREEDCTKLDDLEKRYINDFGTLEPYGYNVRIGGAKGSRHSDASRERMRQSKLGMKNHNYGNPREDLTKKRISDAKKGEKHHFYGKELTYEHKLNLSKSHKKEDLPMYLVRLKERPAPNYTGPGYAVINHPKLKTKYFTSKKLSMDKKLHLATTYLNTASKLT